MDFIPTQRNENFLVNRGYLFLRERINPDGRIIWKCKEHGKLRLSCRKRIHTLNTEVIKEIGEHSNAPNPAEVDAKRAQAELRKEAATSQESTQMILANTFNGLHSSAIAKLPSFPNMKRMIQRNRNIAAGMF